MNVWMAVRNEWVESRRHNRSSLKLLFLPGRLTDGIEPSDDPLIAARDGSYTVSFGRRSANPNVPTGEAE